MGKQRRDDINLTILDAIWLAVMPRKHRIAAIAAMLITAGNGFPYPVHEAHAVAALLCDTSEEEDTLVDEILGEVRRQTQIKIDRLDRRRKLKKALAMGKELDKPSRINRVCQKIFGDPSLWMPVSRVTPRLNRPYFNWFHRAEDGVIVAGVDGVVSDDLATGFVYYDRKGPVRFARLPSRARNVKELCLFLGLHPRLLNRRETKVDWGRRAFIVDGSSRLPWVYP